MANRHYRLQEIIKYAEAAELLGLGGDCTIEKQHYYGDEATWKLTLLVWADNDL